MYPKQTTCRLICLFLPFTAILLSDSCSARGQAAVPSSLYEQSLDKQRVTLQIKQKKLTEVVSLLSEAIGCGVIVDDEPSEQRIDVEVTGTGRDALNAVSKACDYSWSLNRSGLVLMRKTFHKPTTLPQMNLPEMRQMAQDSMNAFSAFHCEPDHLIWANQLRMLASSFTPIQLEPLRTGKMLRLADLSQEQGSLLQQAIVNHAFSSFLEGWTALSNALEQLPASSLEMRAVTERRGGVEKKGAVLEQVRQGSNGKEIRTRLSFQADEKTEEKKP